MRSARPGAGRRLVTTASALTLCLTALATPAASAATTVSTFTASPIAAIPDDDYNGGFAGMVSSTINATIPAVHVVTQITVEVGASHPWVGDLTIKLRSPTDKTLTLVERPQGDGGNALGDDGGSPVAGDGSNLSAAFRVSFNDGFAHDPEHMGLGISEGSDTVCEHDGRCQFFPNPDQSPLGQFGVATLAGFVGERGAGNWTLGIGDSLTGNAGFFDRWAITISHESRLTTISSPHDVVIPDNGYNGTFASMATSTISVSLPDGELVTHLTVILGMTHGWVGDVTIKLRSPAGTILALAERPVGDGPVNSSGDDGTGSGTGDGSNLIEAFLVGFNDTYGDDPESMGFGIADNQAVCFHDLRCEFFPNPDQALVANTSVANLAAFTGEPASGDWTIAVGDSATGDVGFIDRWVIRIGHAPRLAACTTSPFPDVAASHPFCAEISWMDEYDISNGFSDGTYRPAGAVTRQAMSAFMARLAGAALTACASPPFPDVPANHPFCSEIKWMKDAGISTGFGDGTYRPSVAVTRQAMSAFMARLAGAALPACTRNTAPFSDVPRDHPFCSEIRWMKTAQVSTGFDDGTYRPSIDVTRQAMSAFVYRVGLHLP